MRTINPELWWLIPLALVPVLIHILIRQRLPIVRWAAMTFLLKALRKNRRKLLLETILLLIVRTAIVIMVVIVVVRPVARAALAWLGSQRQRTVSVIVLDDSASMAASDGIRTRFQRGLSRIEQYLSELPGGSEVAVLLAANPPMDLIRLPTRDLTYVRDALAKLEARDGTAALPAALDRARAYLADVPTPNREIVLVTDAQAADWQRDAARLRAALANAAQSATTVILTVPPTPPANVAITHLSISGGPKGLTPSLATTFWPTAIHVELQAFHHAEPPETIVELFVNDGLSETKVKRRRVTLPVDRPTVETFEYQFHAPGEYAITARCENDLFPRDNERSIVVEVQEQIDVLMVDGRPATDPFASATGYLRVALWPTDPDESESVSPFRISVVPSDALATVSFADSPLIVLADVAALPTSSQNQITEAVRRGAGLLFIAGEQVTASSMAGMAGSDEAGLLPVRLAGPKPPTADQGPLGLELAVPLPPALSAFEDPTLAEALSRVRWQTRPPPAEVRGDGTQVWATFSHGEPALVAGTHEKGRVLYFAGAADRHGGDFPLSPAFVPFFQQLAFHLLHGAEGDVTLAGQPLDWPTHPAGWPDDPADVALEYPDGHKRSADTLMVEDTDTGEKRFRLPAADRAGVYTLRGMGAHDVSLTPLQRAVGLPSDEFDPTMLQADALRDDHLPDAIRLVDPDEPMRDALRSARTQAELWPLALVLLIVLVAAELLLVRLFAPRQVDAEAMLQRAMRL